MVKKLLLFLCISILALSQVMAQVTYTWNGSVNQNWNTNNNWTPSGSPGASDHVIIVTGSNPCRLTGNQSITNLTVTSGTLDLNGRTLAATGNCVFTAGSVTAGVLTITGSTAATTTFTNTTIAATLSVTSGNIYFNGGTFNGTVYARKTGTSNNAGNGGCTFNADVDFGLTSSGYFMFAGTSFDNYNGNVIISNTGSAGFYWGWNSAGVNLANGKTVTAGSFAANTLFIVGLTQAGTAAQNITLTGTAALDLRRSIIGGDLTVTAPRMTFTTSTFNGTCNFTKNGAGNDASAGGNTFNSPVTINLSGSGYFMFAGTSNDIFNDNIVVNNTGANNIYIGWNSATVTLATGKTITVGTFAANTLFLSGFIQVGNTTQNINLTGTAAVDISRASFDARLNITSPRIALATSTFISPCNFSKTGAGNDASTGGNTFMASVTISLSGSGYFMFAGSQNDIFNDNVIVNNTGTHNIYLGWNSSTFTLASGKTITAGTFTANTLFLCNFMQLGTTAQNITLTGTAGVSIIGSNFGADLNVIAPRISLTTSTFNGLCSFTKNGAGNDAGNGGNTYVKDVTITNTGSGYLMFAGSLNDNFLENIVVNNTGTHDIFLGWNSTGITLQNTKTLSAGTYNANTLYLANCTQIGSTTQNLTLTGTAGINITNGAFAADLNVTAPRIILGTSTFNGVCTFSKTGAGSDVGLGGNTYNKNVTISNSGAGYFMFSGNGTANDMFNENIVVNNTGTNSIFLGWNSGTVTLANTKTITAGSYAVNNLYLCNFNQIGATTQNITLTGTAVIDISKSTFNAALNVIAPRIYLGTTTFNEVSTFTKTGAGNDQSGGGNTFNKDVTISNSGSGYFMFASTLNDLFNENIVVNSTATGSIYLGWNAGIVTLVNAKTITAGTFTANTLFLHNFKQIGSTTQNITLTGTAALDISGTTVFDAALNVISPRITLATGTFNGVSSFSKTGAGNDQSVGGNTFNQNTTISVSGSGYFMFAATSNDLFNENIIVNNTGTHNIYLGWNSATVTLVNGKTITAGTYIANTLFLHNFKQIGTTTQNITLTGTATFDVSGTTVFDADLNVLSPRITLANGTFHGVNTFYKTGAGNDQSAGGNTFDQNTTISVSGSGYFMFAATNNDNFNGNIYVNNTGTNHIYLGWNTATVTMANTKVITALSYAVNTLFLNGFIQLGTTPQNIVLTGTATLDMGRCIFNAPLTTSSPRLYIYTSTYNGTITSTKTGAGNDDSNGGNTFNGVAIMTNSGSGHLKFAATTADTWNTDATFNNTGSSNIFCAFGSANNTYNGITTFNNTPTSAASVINCNSGGTNTRYNGDIVVSCINGGGVLFSSGTGTAILAATKTISVGSGGFNSGTLDLPRFTQTGNTAQNITLTNTARLKYGPASTFGGDVTSTSPELYFQGCTFSRTTNCTKSGAVDNNSDGGNIFTGVSQIFDSGSGYLLFSNLTRDQFLTDVTFTNTGSNTIWTAFNTANNVFGGNVTVHLSGATAAANCGFNMCANANASATITGNFVINNNAVSGATPGGFICDGTSSSLTVNGNTTINNGGANSTNFYRWADGLTTVITFNGDVTVNNNGVVGNTQVVNFASRGQVRFNGNVLLTSTGGTGITFGNNGGSVLQANNKTINTGTYTGGNLYIKNYTQSGATFGNVSNVSITGTNALLTILNSSFYDNLTGTAQLIDVSSTTFRGDATLTKTAGGNNTNSWAGGNVFNGTTIITNQAAAHNLSMANTVSDDYNGNVTFVKTGAGALQPNYNTSCTYAGNITVNSATVITFGVGGASGVAVLDGGNSVSINKTGGSADPKFTKLTISKSAGDVTLNTKINVSVTLTPTWGIVNTSQTNILNMLDASTTTVGNVNSYINGPMNYDMALSGTRTLNLPIGKVPDWRPAELTAVHNAATSYTYNCEVFDSSARWWGWTLPATVDLVSNLHFWDINRTLTGGATSSAGNIVANQTIKLYYSNNDGVTNTANLTIVKNTAGAPTAWIDIGGTGATITSGSVSSTSAPTAFNSYSRFTLGNKTGGTNPLPVELISFTAVKNKNVVDLNWTTKSEVNSNHFEIEKSKNLNEVVSLGIVKAAGYSTSILNYALIDEKPFDGDNYYRLKEYDNNNVLANTSEWVKVNFESINNQTLQVFPNPIEYGEQANVILTGFNPSAKILVILRDVTGKEIYTKVLITNVNGQVYSAIDAEQNLSAGVYIVVASSDDKLFNQKLIIK